MLAQQAATGETIGNIFRQPSFMFRQLHLSNALVYDEAYKGNFTGQHFRAASIMLDVGHVYNKYLYHESYPNASRQTTPDIFLLFNLHEEIPSIPLPLSSLDLIVLYSTAKYSLSTHPDRLGRPGSRTKALAGS